MSFDFAQARALMVESQVRVNDVTDLTLQDAMRRAPRETLIPGSKRMLAYAEAPVEYAPGRWLMEPRDVAKLLQALHPKAGESALAIAAPYAAMLLEQMGLTVTRHDGEDLTALPAGAFDVVISEGAVPTPPRSWTASLSETGRLAVVEREGPVGRARVHERTVDGLAVRTLFDSTPPLLAGLARQPTFSF